MQSLGEPSDREVLHEVIVDQAADLIGQRQSCGVTRDPTRTGLLVFGRHYYAADRRLYLGRELAQVGRELPDAATFVETIGNEFQRAQVRSPHAAGTAEPDD